MTKRIVIIDPDHATRTMLSEYFGQFGPDVADTYFDRPEPALEALRSCDISGGDGQSAGSPCANLLIVSDNQGDMGFRAFCDRLDAIDPLTPRMILSSELSVQDLEGCVVHDKDIFKKPVYFGQFLARVRHHLNQARPLLESDITIGPYRFDYDKRCLETGGGTIITLTDRECDILTYLYLNRQTAISREALLNEVWRYKEGVETHTLETHIYRLRQKIEADPADCKIIVTEDDGYRLVS